MKRKISFLVAVVMILSLLPAMGVSAATKNAILVSGGTVADDYVWSKTTGSRSAVPILSIKEDSAQNVMEGKKFTITLDNAEWEDFDEDNFESKIMSFLNPDVAEWGESTATGERVLLIDSAVEDELVTDSGAVPSMDYEIEFITSDVAEVRVTSTATDNTLLIPLMVEMQGTGPANVTVGDTGSTGVTAGQLTFATGASGSTITTVKKSTDTFNTNFELPAITVTETTPNTINKDEKGNSTIEFVAPNGFEWATTASMNPEQQGKARFYLGYNVATLGLGEGFDISSSDAQLLTFTVPKTYVTSNSAGAIEFTGLYLKRVDKNSDISSGDLRVKVNVKDGTSGYVTIGVFATKGVTLTAEDKTLPEIVSGKYLKDWDDATTQVVDVTIEETVADAWNQNTDAIFTLNSDVKFRGVEVKTADGVTASLTTSDEVFFRAPESGDRLKNSEITSTSSGCLLLEDDTVTITGLKRKGTDKFKIKLRCYVTVKPGYTGDITFATDEDNEAFGTGISTVVAKAIDPFTITTATTDIELGYMNIPVGDITVKENQAGALQKMETASGINRNSYLQDDRNIEFWIGGYSGNNIAFKDNDTFKYEVVSGDIVIDDLDVITDTDSSIGSKLQLDIKRESSTASEIKLSGLTVDANRSIPEGKMELRVGGSVTANYYGNGGVSKDNGGFNVSYLVASKDYVNVITAADGKDTKYTTEVAVTIGSTTIKANSTETTMDVAPYIQDGYTMVPTRAVVVALGVSNDQVMWDSNTKTVTILDTNRGRTSQFVVGSNTISVSGQNIPFTGPSCANVEGRTFLPFRALGEIVLGCPVEWDEASRTAYFNKAS